MDKIIYFSGTGNTAYIADQIEIRLKEKGRQVLKEPMEKTTAEQIGPVDTLYFGFPIYACDMPETVRRFVEDLPAGKGTLVRLFDTMAYFSGKAMNRAARLFSDKGYTVTSYYERKMPGSDGLAFLKKEGKTVKKLLGNFNSQMTDLDSWLQSEELIGTLNVFPDIGGKIVSGMLKLAEGGMKKKFRADERCISCGLCSRICPAGNIELIEKSVTFGDDCILCMRCIHQCPVEAIQIGKGTVDKFRYKGPEGHFSIH